MTFIPNRDFLLEVGKGTVTGHTGQNISGAANDIDTNAVADIWDGSSSSFNNAFLLWVPFTVAQTVDVFSDDSNDNIVGTGAQQVLIKGLDQDWNPVEEVLDLNGTTAETTVSTYIRINYVEVISFGTSGINEGTIEFEGSIDGTLECAILEGVGETKHSRYSIPANHYVVVTNIWASVTRGNPSNVSYTANFLKRENADQTNSGIVTIEEPGVFVNRSDYTHKYNPPRRFEEKTDLWFRATDCTDNNTSVDAGFDLVLVTIT